MCRLYLASRRLSPTETAETRPGPREIRGLADQVCAWPPGALATTRVPIINHDVNKAYHDYRVLGTE